MRLSDLMIRSLEVVHPSFPVAEAATRMRKLDRDVLPVGDDERIVGLLVGQDVAERATSSGRDPQMTPVREVMLADVVYGYENQDVTEAVRLMRERKLPQLIVVNRDHSLVGFVNLKDLAAGSGDATGPGEMLAHALQPAHLHWGKPVYKRIVVALDGSELAEHILSHVIVMAGAFGATVTLLRVTPLAEAMESPAAGLLSLPGELPTGPHIDPMTLVETERREGWLYLASLMERLRSQGVSVDCAQPEGSPATAIVEVARQKGADLIALTSHGRGGLGRLVFGSVAESVLRSTPCPLLVVRVGENSRLETM